MREPDDCTVKCPPFTKILYSDVDKSYACDYTEWAYSLFATVACALILVPILLLICAVCKKRRGSIGSRGSNSQYQVVSEEDIEAPLSSESSYGTFDTGQKLSVPVPDTSPFITGIPGSPSSSRASVSALVDNVSLNMRNELMDTHSPLPPSALAQDPALRPRMPTPGSLNRSINGDITSGDFKLLNESKEEPYAKVEPQQQEAPQDVPVEQLVDVDSQPEQRRDNSYVLPSDTPNIKEEKRHTPSDAGYVVFEPNTSDSFVNISQVHDDSAAKEEEPLYSQLEGPDDQINNLDRPLGESTPRKGTLNDELHADDQETLVGSCEDDDSVLHLEESLELDKEEQEPYSTQSASLPTSAIPYYVPLNYGKEISKSYSEPNATPFGQGALASSPGSDSVEVLPAEAETKFLDSLSTMASSYYTAADPDEVRSQDLSDNETPEDEEVTIPAQEERRPRYESRADFENVLILSVTQSPVEERNGMFLLRDSVSEPDYKVLTLYAKVPTSEQVIYHFKISTLSDGRSSILNGLRILPNLPSLLQYLREEKDVLPCTLTKQIQWDKEVLTHSALA